MISKRSDELFYVSYCLPKVYRESHEGQALLRKIEETIADKQLTFAKVVEPTRLRGTSVPKRHAEP
jgi:hypothetical protein